MGRAHGADHLWADYWADAPPESCTALLPEDARRAIDAVWRNAVEALDHGASVLDIAAGRGAVLALAASCRGDLALTGVDSAPASSVAPANEAAAGFRILGDVDAAALPFPNRAFALVASQFGVEYADFDRALSEAMRVCAGRLLLLVHASDGIVVAQNAGEAAQIEWVLDTLRLFEKQARAFRASSGKITATVKAALDMIDKQRTRTDNPRLLDAIMQGALQLHAIAARHGAAAALEAAQAMEARMRNHAARMAALADAALGPGDCERALGRIRDGGFSQYGLHEVRAPKSGALTGRWICAARQGGDHPENRSKTHDA